MDIFTFMYSLFVSWYGTDLDDFLSNPDEGMNYLIIGVVTIVFSVLVCALYYKILDKPRWAHWYCWVIALVINAFINFWWGWQPVLQNLYDGDMDVLNQQTGQMVTYVTENNCLMFGIANAALASIIFALLSFLFFKHISTNCKYSPLCK